MNELTPRPSIVASIEQARAKARCAVCNTEGARPYPAGPRCDDHAPQWSEHTYQRGDSERELTAALVQEIQPVPDPVIFMAAHEDAERELLRGNSPKAGLVAQIAAECGWSVIVTHALAGVHMVKAVKAHLRPDLSPVGDRVTVDVVTPEVVETVAVRCARGTERLVACWANGELSCGVAWSDVEPLRPLLVRALIAALRS
jgi:hypothetical protein